MSAAGLPRLLSGLEPERALTRSEHEQVHGALPDLRRLRQGALIDIVERAGLRGRGGGGFPTAVKLRGVASGRRPVVVANCSEGEPASAKDRVLARHLPHLVIDGALVAAAAVGAEETIISVPGTDPEARRALAAALAERGLARDALIRLLTVPDRYLAGQEGALVNFINTGALLPTTTPPLPFERGVGGRRTLVQNVETLAHLALIARHGPEWFRELGPADEPGSTLVTLSGAVRCPGVYEVARGSSLAELLASAGGTTDAPRALLTGGYFGQWVDRAATDGALLSDDDLSARGAGLGAGVLVLLGQRSCGVAETVRALGYLADQSAGQCGPCMFGLPAIARTLEAVAAGRADSRAPADLRRWFDQVAGRGACHLPDGAVGLARSALTVFAHEFKDHYENGPCEACHAPAVLPVSYDEEVAA